MKYDDFRYLSPLKRTTPFLKNLSNPPKNLKYPLTQQTYRENNRPIVV